MVGLEGASAKDGGTPEELRRAPEELRRPEKARPILEKNPLLALLPPKLLNGVSPSFLSSSSSKKFTGNEKNPSSSPDLFFTTSMPSLMSSISGFVLSLLDGFLASSSANSLALSKAASSSPLSGGSKRTALVPPSEEMLFGTPPIEYLLCFLPAIENLLLVPPILQYWSTLFRGDNHFFTKLVPDFCLDSFAAVGLFNGDASCPSTCWSTKNPSALNGEPPGLRGVNPTLSILCSSESTDLTRFKAPPPSRSPSW
mmetsp:Transcript_14721/g.27580  ORF Transcript_14721/g.27580 Transcript_14721/m.27580 type:complete len:256 (-) Transcript_14721:129-896(-)